MLEITQVLLAWQNNNQILRAQSLRMVLASNPSTELEKVGKERLVLPFVEMIHSKEEKKCGKLERTLTGQRPKDQRKWELWLIVLGSS